MLEQHRTLPRHLFEKDEIQGWLYGPVVPSIYVQYQVWRKNVMTDEGEVYEEFNTAKINSIIDVLIQVDPFKLVEISVKNILFGNNMSAR